MSLSKKWMDVDFVAVDLETTGQFPIESEICEIGAIKWSKGKVVDVFTTLIKPTYPMSEEVIKIHNITNEMVKDAPLITEKLKEFDQFIKGCYLVAHHAPFDIGFLAYEYEKQNLPLPQLPIFCSSILSRNLIPESPNHRLQTLIQFLKIDGGSAHRAYDDAQACLQVALKCFEKLGPVSLDEIVRAQKKYIYWGDYSIKSLQHQIELLGILEACLHNKPAKIIYQGGSKPGSARIVYPKGIVRNPNGDFLAASDSKEGLVKRFYLNRIRESEALKG